MKYGSFFDKSQRKGGIFSYMENIDGGTTYSRECVCVLGRGGGGGLQMTSARPAETFSTNEDIESKYLLLFSKSLFLLHVNRM